MTEILDQFRLNGRTALVTGGAGLLGRQFTQTLAQAGASVIVADLDFQAASEQAQALQGAGLPAVAAAVDVTDPESVEEMIARTVADFGGVDILVNSAALDPKFDPAHVGEQSANAFENYALAAWQKTIDVNLTGVFLVSQAVLRRMTKSGSGVIINISSVYGLSGPDQRIYPPVEGKPQYKPVDYSVTKAGILGLTRYLAAYYAGTKIRVNALTPGGVYNQHEEAFSTQYSAKTMAGRMARLDEMNGALLFLASDASSYMTGSNLIVDGGYLAW